MYFVVKYELKEQKVQNNLMYSVSVYDIHLQKADCRLHLGQSSILVNLMRRSGLMVSVLVPGASGPGSSPGRGQCVVFLGKTLNSHSASLHPGV